MRMGALPLLRLRESGDAALAGAAGRVAGAQRSLTVDHGAPAAARVWRLADLAEGATGRVVRLEHPGSSATTQLVALGIYPGAEVKLVQRFPAFVLQVGLAEVALDQQMAERVWVACPDQSTD
jgi:Fe2+ transport system protein FeoA